MIFLLLAVLALGLGFFLTRYYLPLRELRQTLASGERLTALRGARVIREITSQIGALREKNSETTERAENEGFNLRAILSSMREGVILLDDQRRVRLANEAIYQLLPTGLSPINRTLLELFRNHHLHRAIERSFRTAEPQMTEFFLEVAEDGRLVTKTFEVTSMAMGGRGVGGAEGAGVAGALAVFHDVTRLKALETVRKEFVANVSHELRTPLSIIGGYIETMLEDDLEDVAAGRKFLRVMHKHTERLHLLVEDLLTISTLESQRATLAFAVGDLRPVVEHVVEQLESALEAKGLRVEVEFPSHFPPVEMDAHRMGQVFFNLLDNAVKHGRAGDRAIRIMGKVLEGGGPAGAVEVALLDGGPGIPRKDLPHIFERFYRVDQARSREVGGTGLGLSIVKHVVQAHGGTVEVRSRVGDGATFLVRLPLRQNAENRELPGELFPEGAGGK